MAARASARGAALAVILALALVIGVGCAAPEPPPPVDITGANTTFVRYAERDGEEIEVRGLRYRHAIVVEREGAADRRRDETRRTLTREQLARVLDWAGEHDVLTLRSPTGGRELPTLAAPPPITLEVAVGEAALGIGWAADSAWSEPAMAERVRSAVAALRAIAGELDRGGASSSGRADSPAVSAIAPARESR